MDKLSDVRVTVEDRDQAKEWLFEYGCQVSEGYNLSPMTHIGFIKYCGVHKLAKIYESAMYAHEDPNWSGMTPDFKLYQRGPKTISHIIKREHNAGTMPTHVDYLAMIHSKSGPLQGDWKWGEGE